MNIRELVSQKVSAAMSIAGIPSNFTANVIISKNAQFGDYQANGTMAAAKAMRRPPRDLAAEIVSYLKLDGIADKVEVAGPGFINISLSSEFLSSLAFDIAKDPRLGIPQAEQADTVVVDYSAPNLAKEMHVGHLRSSIIGDAQVRLMEFLGHHVIRQNHIGDWGTQFGMLIAELEEALTGDDALSFELKDLETFYQRSKAHFDADPAFATKSRDYVVRLQSGDAQVLALWKRFIDLSMHHAEEIYQLLNVSLTRKDVQGESAYNADLPVLVKELKDQNLAVESEGALVVFLDELADKDGNPSPVIIQKQGGGFLYATTDLAAIRYRTNTLKADRVLVFTDARQALHFKQIFLVAEKAGFSTPNAKLVHCPFGMMLGQDGKPFKTRSGGVVKLADLLKEAIERSEALVMTKNPDLDADTQADVARKVAIGAVKYADLSKTRTHDYVFNWDAMLSFEGNTAPYLQYAYTRIQSIARKANASTDVAPLILETAQERALAIKLIQFEEALEQVNREAQPHIICTYLYDLASLFMSYYEHCPILKPEVPEPIKNSRLTLNAATARTLQLGLDLLGIEVMEQM
jgi:arginyl-tRNA synthetase